MSDEGAQLNPHSNSQTCKLVFGLSLVLKQATVQEIKDKRIVKGHGELVVVTRYYPRYLRRPLIHHYLPDLAPNKSLLKAFKDREAELGDHDQAFLDMDYQNLFELSPAGLDDLERLSNLALSEDVYLICHCDKSQYCHRELLILLAEHHFQSPHLKLSHSYEIYRARLKESSE